MHGAEYRGKKSGTFGDISCFSFYGNKIITTGEDSLGLMTAHREFRELDLQKVKGLMRKPIMIGGRWVFIIEGVRGLGFVYRGVGARFNYKHNPI